MSIFGNPLDMDKIIELKKKYDLPIIEDAACSMGSEYKGRKVGSIADITVFSFHPRKVFSTGDGGLAVTNNDKYNECKRVLKELVFSICNKVKFITNFF